MTRVRRPSHRWFTYSVGSVALLVAGAACSWAVLTVLKPAEDPLVATQHTYAEVRRGDIGASLSLNVVAKWTSVPAGINQAGGVLTSIDIQAGQEVDQGTELYSVNLRPVAVAEGAVPAFRSIAADAEGADVKQLQAMLASLGLYGGSLDGKAGAGTVRAIEQWQVSRGLEKTGIVDLGDVVFIQTLPGRVTVDTETVHVGSVLVGGEQMVESLSASPAFTLSVTESQAAVIPTGTRIEIASPSGTTWTGVTTGQATNPANGTIDVTVSGEEGDSICRSECDALPVSEETTLPATVITVPTVSGLVVPSSALITTANGQTAVVDSEGNRIAITIEASAKGMSVISGVEEGLKVEVPASGDVSP